MVGPDKQFDQEEVLNKALEVFWANGYEATSMQDLVNHMGINRASMYQTFGNKHELFLASLERYISAGLARLQDSLSATGSPMDNLYRVFEYFIEQGLQGEKMYGCFVSNTAIELGPHDPQVADKVRYFWGAFEALIRELLQRAIEKKELAEHTDIEHTALLLNIHLQGLMAKVKISASRDELVNATRYLFKLVREK